MIAGERGTYGREEKKSPPLSLICRVGVGASRLVPPALLFGRGTASPERPLH